MYDSSVRLLITLYIHFIKPHLLNQDIHLLKFSNPDHTLTLSEIFVISECEKLLQRSPIDLITNFKQTCLQFYITSAEEIVNCLHTNNKMFEEIRFLNTKYSLCFENNTANI